MNVLIHALYAIKEYVTMPSQDVGSEYVRFVARKAYAVTADLNVITENGYVVTVITVFQTMTVINVMIIIFSKYNYGKYPSA